ncbi:amidohydrolase family protein [Tomitella biformata]|uniref:amidohydrolase family protein n=1 Tax=Tomitella biformata TaxID=630403 RepID=UPI000466F6E7|nr:amidohydrolase family protein [Tomitella biformata]
MGDTGAWRIRGRALPGGEPCDWFVRDGLLTAEPVAGAVDLLPVDSPAGDSWILPGLVDAHCHVGVGRGSVGTDINTATAQAVAERDAGVLLLRDAGVPVDTRALDQVPGLPRIIRAGQHLALPKRYMPALGLHLNDESELPDAVAAQARAGDGWVKLVGDWIDRGVGDLAPLWSPKVLKEAIGRAHDEGARVTAHVFGFDALPGLLDAGIDCIEHGAGLDAELIAQMRSQGTALVPTIINIASFPGIADGAGRYPVYAAHMRALHARNPEMLAMAIDAGLDLYAGTDAGGFIDHGRVVDEIEALSAAGLGNERALAAGSWAARRWLTGQDGLVEGARADLVAYASDPRVDLNVLRSPSHILLGGSLVGR